MFLSSIVDKGSKCGRLAVAAHGWPQDPDPQYFNRGFWLLPTTRDSASEPATPCLLLNLNILFVKIYRFCLFLLNSQPASQRPASQPADGQPASQPAASQPPADQPSSQPAARWPASSQPDSQPAIHPASQQPASQPGCARMRGNNTSRSAIPLSRPLFNRLFWVFWQVYQEKLIFNWYFCFFGYS